MTTELASDPHSLLLTFLKTAKNLDGHISHQLQLVLDSMDMNLHKMPLTPIKQITTTPKRKKGSKWN
jgi:hypothetical protein